MKDSNVVYLNGKKVKNRNLISIYNPTFLYGINCFEGIRIYYNQRTKKNHLLAIDQHIERLFESAKVLCFIPPL